jgi:hypothetical protein
MIASQAAAAANNQRNAANCLSNVAYNNLGFSESTNINVI